MALSLESEQRMKRVGLVEFYVQNETVWADAASQAYKFVKDNFPDGALIRRDDVTKSLVPVLEVNELLRNKLNESKLRQKFWITHFADLIIDKCWDGLKEKEDD